MGEVGRACASLSASPSELGTAVPCTSRGHAPWSQATSSDQPRCLLKATQPISLLCTPLIRTRTAPRRPASSAGVVVAGACATVPVPGQWAYIDAKTRVTVSWWQNSYNAMDAGHGRGQQVGLARCLFASLLLRNAPRSHPPAQRPLAAGTFHLLSRHTATDASCIVRLLLCTQAADPPPGSMMAMMAACGFLSGFGALTGAGFALHWSRDYAGRAKKLRGCVQAKSLDGKWCTQPLGLRSGTGQRCSPTSIGCMARRARQSPLPPTICRSARRVLRHPFRGSHPWEGALP